MVGAFLPPTQPPTEGANGGGGLTSPNQTFRELARKLEKLIADINSTVR